MNAFNLIQDKVAYNQWANLKMIDWLQLQSSDLFEKEVVSSFPTINKLIHHMLDAEKYYLSILQETQEEYSEVLSTEQLFEALKTIDQKLFDWLSNQQESDMDKIISLKRSPFVETYSVATILTHLINHTTYHRGQLIALRHQLKMSEAPKIDYYRYFIALAQTQGRVE